MGRTFPCRVPSPPQSPPGSASSWSPRCPGRCRNWSATPCRVSEGDASPGGRRHVNSSTHCLPTDIDQYTQTGIDSACRSPRVGSSTTRNACDSHLWLCWRWERALRRRALPPRVPAMHGEGWAQGGRLPVDHRWRRGPGQRVLRVPIIIHHGVPLLLFHHHVIGAVQWLEGTTSLLKYIRCACRNDLRTGFWRC